MSVPVQRNTNRTSANASLLDQYDDLDQAPTFDTQEQEQVIAELRAKNDSSNYTFRALMLIMLSLVFVLYLTPIPAYIRGEHPALELFHQNIHVQGTAEHITYLPAFPFYLLVLFIHGTILYASAIEVLVLMGHIGQLRKLKLPGVPKAAGFPYQPHQYNTAPNWLVPVLNDIKYSPGTKTSQRADTQPAPAPASGVPVASTLGAPRLLYLWVLLVASTPMPLVIFGAGNFESALWWAFSTAVMAVLVTVETWIVRSEKELLGLDGLKYQAKTA